jgi:hypothetical protein
MAAPALRGIDLVLDSAGRKKADLIDLRRHSEVWEDLFDSIIVEQRRSEPRESLAEVRRRLKSSSEPPLPPGPLLALAQSCE